MARSAAITRRQPAVSTASTHRPLPSPLPAGTTLPNFSFDNSMKMKILFHASFVLVLSSCYSWPASATMAHNNHTDLSALLAFKAHVSDPNGILESNWTTNTSFCNWVGVFCSRRHGQRVTAINLYGFSLEGTIAPHMANLSFMSDLILGNNSLQCPIPQALGGLRRLRTIVLENNQLTGEIPSAIFNMSSLTNLYLAGNNLSGPLPRNDNLTTFCKLERIALSSNQLEGEIPSSFARFLGLELLSLSNNQLSGSIPPELGSLPELSALYLGSNSHTGVIPASLGILTKLAWLDLSTNGLAGGIPEELGNLANLQQLELHSNGLTGSIPDLLMNASSLSTLDLNSNNLTGFVPIELGKHMTNLSYLNLQANQLTGGFDFIASLSNCWALQKIFLSINKLDGTLPDSVGNLSSHLLEFDASANHITGRIPAEFGNLSSLLLLDLSYNDLTEALSSAITKLEGLQVLYLGENRIHGHIPYDLGRMRSLSELDLELNALSGSIPESLGNLSGLQLLSLPGNSLSSGIPKSIWNLTGLINLYLLQNALDGILPPEVGNLKAMNSMDLSTNRLSGDIPSALGNLQMLEALDLSHNAFSGNIPQSFGGMISLKVLNLSNNNLSGTIPGSFTKLKYLVTLNLSFNNLEGRIPHNGTFSNITFQSLMGNVALCGAPKIGFPACTENASSNSRKGTHLLRYILPVIASVLVLLTCIGILLICLRRKPETAAYSNTTNLHDHRLISYEEIVRGTDRFSEANLLGRGSFGSVFKGLLDDGLLVAVKVLNLEVEGALRSFDVECQALRMIRHRNLVKIISTCSNLDFKALVLQFMPSGSLERWLYSHNHCLSLLQRINVVLDVALALEYLHHHSPQVVVHCDLKPSNVLLDEEMNAHVGDFGIAKLLFGDSRSLVSAATPGTIGYMPPEYGSSGRVSRRGDVYSYGILLLETFTRKKPTDDMFVGEGNLRQWVSKAMPDKVEEIVDCNLFSDDAATRSGENLSGMHQCLSSVMELGLLCSKESAEERILMKDVVPKLQKIRMEYLSKLPSA